MCTDVVTESWGSNIFAGAGRRRLNFERFNPLTTAHLCVVSLIPKSFRLQFYLTEDRLRVQVIMCWWGLIRICFLDSREFGAAFFRLKFEFGSACSFKVACLRGSLRHEWLTVVISTRCWILICFKYYIYRVWKLVFKRCFLRSVDVRGRMVYLSFRL